MRLPIHVVLLGLVANAFGFGNSYLSAQRAGIARTPIFRYIDVRPYGVLQLGKAFDSTAILGVALRPGVFRLDRKDGQPVQLGDTRAIPVLATWLDNYMFAGSSGWTSEFVTHTIKVLQRQSGLNTRN